MMYILKILTGEKDELYTIVTEDIVKFRVNQSWVDNSKILNIQIYNHYNVDKFNQGNGATYWWKVELL